jgi:hypothetical protein
MSIEWLQIKQQERATNLSKCHVAVSDAEVRVNPSLDVKAKSIISITASYSNA